MRSLDKSFTAFCVSDTALSKWWFLRVCDGEKEQEWFLNLNMDRMDGKLINHFVFNKRG